MTIRWPFEAELEPPMRPVTYRNEEERFARKLERGRTAVQSAGQGLDPVVLDSADRHLRGLENLRTATTYCTGLKTFFHWCKVEVVDPLEMRPSDARLFRASLGHLAPNTRDSYLGAVSSLFNAMLDDDKADRNPFVRVRVRAPAVQTETPALTLAEYERVLGLIATSIAHGDSSLVERRDYAIIYVAGRLGIRAISARLLRWRDWRPIGDRGELTVYLKGEKRLKLDVPPDVARTLEEWKVCLTAGAGRDMKPSDAVFPPIGSESELVRAAKGGKPLRTITGESLWAIVRGRFLDVGLEAPRMGFHVLRATSATLADEADVPIEVIQDTLGHASPETTRIYLKRRGRRMAADAWTPSLASMREPEDGAEAA